MKFSPDGLLVLRNFEDCVLAAYPDPGTGGAPWTIGWGHTGPEVVPGLEWSQTIADRTLIEVDIPPREMAVERMVGVAMTQGQFDALVDFAYNKGEDALRKSTLLKRFNSGDTLGAAAEFDRWVFSGRRRMRGLVRRAAAQRALFEGHTGAGAIEIGRAAA